MAERSLFYLKLNDEEGWPMWVRLDQVGVVKTGENRDRCVIYSEKGPIRVKNSFPEVERELQKALDADADFQRALARMTGTTNPHPCGPPAEDEDKGEDEDGN